MTEKMIVKSPSETGKPEIVVTRIFDAPRELVWKAWTDCDLVKQWFGPKGFTSPFCKIDLRVGGKALYVMRGSDNMGIWSGKDIWSTGIYREIIPSERIVTTDSFSDENGNVVPATRYGMNASFPLEMLLTVTFEDYAGKTKLTVRHVGIPSGEDSEDAQSGWNESLDKLADLLTKLK